MSRKKILIIIAIVILVIIVIILNITWNNNDVLEEPVIIKEEEEKTEKKDPKEVLYQVDVKGEVLNPGVYDVISEARVIDVINLAGGFTASADTSNINLSKKITDEMVIVVATKGTPVEKQEVAPINNDAAIISKESSTAPGIININTASLEELMSLSGIGEAKAKSIISYRQTKGNFKNIEEIKEVSGIGESIFAKIKENITT